MTAKKILMRILFGLMFITAGVGYVGKALGLWSNFTVFFPGWWTLFIIIPAICSLIYEGIKLYNLIMLLFGATLLLTRNNVISLEFRTMWILFLAIVLILIGLKIIFNPVFEKSKFKYYNKSKTIYTTGGTTEVATFSEKNINFNGREFKGIKLEANFASINLDLRKAIINEDVQIEAEVNFSGVKIYLPEGFNLELKAKKALGSVSNKYAGMSSEGSPTIYIFADCSFGGIQIF